MNDGNRKLSMSSKRNVCKFDKDTDLHNFKVTPHKLLIFYV